ncbi:MAG: cytochrome P450 [Nostoc sp.]|uniref:cytochrome P450 n=1 Tax=Nostoc sp. TaxID=1180 RepID=UPI002FF83A57
MLHPTYNFSQSQAYCCIGIAFAKMEMKIVAAHLLRNYYWEILPNQSLETMFFPSNRPKDGLLVRFQPW